jgi:hypothetical protein
LLRLCHRDTTLQQSVHFEWMRDPKSLVIVMQHSRAAESMVVIVMQQIEMSY